MKNLSLLFLTVIPLISFSATDPEIQDFLTEEKIDIEEFNKMNSDDVKILTKSITTDKEFLQKIITQTNQLKNQEQRDPNLLVQAVIQKASLEVDFSTNRIKERLQVVDRDLAYEANFPVASSSGTSSRNVFVVQYIGYKEFPERSGQYIGYGLYMSIDASSFESNSNITLPYLAATATLNNKSFNMDAELIGFDGVEANALLQTAMPGSDFNINSYAGYVNFKTALIEGIRNKTIKISPVPIIPWVNKQIMEQDGITLTRTHALMCIARGDTLEKAIKSFERKSKDSDLIIQNVYSEYASITKMKEKPSPIKVESVKGMLKTIGIKV